MGGAQIDSRPRFWHILLLLPLVAIVVWVVDRGKATRDNPADVLKHLKTAQAPSLPETRAAGASERTPLEQYDRESLYEYIDGAADAFIQRGFERCTVATYTMPRAGAKAVEVVAEAYRFASADGTRQQLEADRPTTARTAAELPEAVTDGTTLLVASGRDLLKLTSLARGDTSPALLAIASAWTKDQPR